VTASLKQLSLKIREDYFELKKNHEDAEERMSKWIVKQAKAERLVLK